MSMAWIHEFVPSKEGETDVMARPTLRVEKVNDTAVRPRQSGPPDPHDQWVPFGPIGVLLGQAAGRPRVTGRIRAFAVDPSGKRIYAGTARGGVWYSEDAGRTWLPIDAFSAVDKLDSTLGEANALSIGAIAVEWGNTAADDVVYVGTGEANEKNDTVPSIARGVGIRVAKGPAQLVKDHGLPTDPWTLESPLDGSGRAVLRGQSVTHLRNDPTRKGVVWAATPVDLYVRTPQTGPTNPWDFAFVAEIMVGDFLDVVLTPGSPPRVVAVTSVGHVWIAPHPFDPASPPRDGANKLIPWTRIKLDVPKKFTFANLALAADAVDPIVYVVANGPRLWRIDCATAKAEPVTGLPSEIFGKQAGYDMAIAAHPTVTGEIIVGGSVHDGDAALFKGTVTKVGGQWKLKTDATSGHVGRGVHADVHAFEWRPGDTPADPAKLWVGCDGGLFYSPSNATRSSFVSLANGISALECNYVALHPTSDTVVLTGSQDNGSLRSLQQEVFRLGALGDAGGVAFDPNDPRRALAQYVNSSWLVSSDGGLTFTKTDLYDLPDLAVPDFWKHVQSGRDSEDKAASFYSEAAVIADDTTTQLAVGTDRVWYSTSFGRKAKAGKPAWVTLPSEKNVVTGEGFINRKRDVIEGGIVALRWADKDRLVILNRSVYLLDRSAAKWAKPTLLPQKFPYNDDNGVEQFSKNPPFTAMAIHRHTRNGATVATDLYIAASGVQDAKLKAKPHVWWFDSTKSQWFNAGFTVDTPIYAVCCDPAEPTVIYLGSDVGVWKGKATFPGDGSKPTWIWTQFVNGLPEVTVDDLVIVDVSVQGESRRLLRAALRGRGVWDLDLGGASVGPELYLRAHDFDSRRWSVANGVLPHPFADPNPGAPKPKTGVAMPTSFPQTLRLDASPDIRIRRAATNPVPPPLLSIPASAPADQVAAYLAWLAETVLRAQSGNVALPSALRTMLREVVPNGVGGTATVQALQALAKALGGPKVPKLTSAAVAALLALPPISLAPNGVLFDNPEPGHADQPDVLDVAAHLRDEPDFGPDPAACAVGDGKVQAHVILHGRHWKGLEPADTWVTLLRTPFTGAPNLAAIPPLPAGWATKLFSDGMDRLTTPVPDQTWLGPNWSYADRVQSFHAPLRAVSPNSPQAVHMELELFSPTTPTGWFLFAVSHTDTDPLLPTGVNLAERDVATLVRTNRHVSLRSVRRQV